MRSRIRFLLGASAAALALLPAVASADTARAITTHRTDASELPAWVQDLDDGRIDLDHALIGAASLADRATQLRSRLAVAVGDGSRRSVAWLAALAGPSSSGDLLAILAEPPRILVARPVEGTLSSAFGLRQDPFRKRRQKNHKGVDIRAERGTVVHAAGTGVVVRARRERGYGKVIYVDHGGALETRYAHLQRIDVATGDQVAAGEPIGRVGSTGRATGPHLHFEVRQAGAPVAPDQIADLALVDGDPALPGIFDAAVAPLAARAVRAVAAADEASEAPKRDKTRRSKDKARRARPDRKHLRSAQPRS